MGTEKGTGTVDDDPEVHRLRRMFQQTGNPTHAARAFQIYSESAHAFDGVILPRWLYGFLDPLMSTIERLFAEAHDRNLTAAEIGAAVANALQLTRSGTGVRGNAFTDRRLDERDHSLAREVWRAKQRRPTRSFEEICADVAEERGVGPDIVERAWSAWRTFFDESDQSS